MDRERLRADGNRAHDLVYYAGTFAATGSSAAIGRCDQFLQFAIREPAFIGVAGIAKSFGQRRAVHPVFAPPPRSAPAE